LDSAKPCEVVQFVLVVLDSFYGLHSWALLLGTPDPRLNLHRATHCLGIAIKQIYQHAIFFDPFLGNADP